MNGPIIDYRRFVDGTTRAIFEDVAGRQYVLGNDGELVYGVWQFDPENAPDIPVIVDADRT
jgi:hypothetical protein